MQFTVQSGALFFDGKPIANFVPTMLGLYQTDGNFGEQPWLLLEIQQENAISKTLNWPAQTLDALNIEKEVIGCVCRDDRGRSTKRLINTYIRLQLNRLAVPPGVYISTTGWHNIDGIWQYCCGRAEEQSVPLSPEGKSPSCLIAAPVKEYRLATAVRLPESATVEDLLQMLARHPDVYLPIWGFSLFSLMRSFLQTSGLPTACILYIIAKQGFGKTSTAKALCQLFDQNGRMADVFDAGSSAAAMRDILMDARDRAVLFDDVFIGTDKARQRERRNTASMLLRFAANEIPISRKSGSQEMRINCAASLIVTGEIPMKSASDITRCMIVRIRKRLADASQTDLHELRHTAATAMQGFLRWFGPQYESRIAQIRTDAEKFLEPFRAAPNERVKQSLFELFWLLCLFFDYAEEIQAISAHARQQFTEASDQALRQVWDNIQTELRRIENRPPSFTDAIVAGLQSHNLRAFCHNGCVCVRTSDLTEYFRQVYCRSDLNAVKVAFFLRKSNLLSLDNSGKSTKKIKGVRYLCIPLTQLRKEGTHNGQDQACHQPNLL